MDPGRIQELSHRIDVKEHKVLGTVHRVKILTVGQEGRRGTKSGDNVALVTRPDKRKHAGDDDEANKTSGSSSSSSSESSSRSSNKKSKKKSKKNKKHKEDSKSKKVKNDKQKEKARLAKEKAEQRNGQLGAKQDQPKVMAMLKTASQVLDEIQPQLGIAQAFIKNPRFSDLASRMIDWINNTVSQGDQYCEQADAAVDSESLVDAPDLKDRQHQKQAGLLALDNILATVFARACCLSIGCNVRFYCS
jgi:hypothetical protein